MFNIKKKRITRKIFFIMIFIYNEKFILNASAFSIMESPHRTTYIAENPYKLMADRFRQRAGNYYTEGKLLQGQGLHEKAQRILDKANILSGEETHCRKRSGELFFNLSEIDKNIAETKYKKYEKNNNLEKHLQESIRLFKEGAEEYVAATTGFKDLEDYYLQQSKLLEGQNRDEEAKKMLEEAKKANQESKEILKNEAYWGTKYATLLSNLGKMREASEEYSTAAMKFHKLKDYYKGETESLKRKNRHEEANKMAQEAKKADQEHEKADKNRACCRLQHEKSLLDLDKMQK